MEQFLHMVKQAQVKLSLCSDLILTMKMPEGLFQEQPLSFLSLFKTVMKELSGL